MKTTTEYPRDYKHTTDGSTAAIRFEEIRVATVPDYSDPTRMVDKLVMEGTLEDTGEPVSYWLGPVSDGGKLVSLFRQELERRVKAGRANFDAGELLTIIRSDEQRPSRTSGRAMWDYSVTFQNAAPKPTATDLLLGSPPPDGDPSAADPPADDIPFWPTTA